MRKMSHSAFTLAEVLITLAIIGVVAALTIPSLMNNINDSELHNKFKKEYSVVNQALEMVRANGESIDYTSHQTFANSLAKYLKVFKSDTATNMGITSPYNYKSTTKGIGDITSDYVLVLNDGTFLLFYSYSTSGDSCELTSVTGNGQTVDSLCGTIDIDVNGFKNPNMQGKDFFRTWLREVNGTPAISPFGFKGEFPCLAGQGNTYSYGCASNVILNKDLP